MNKEKGEYGIIYCGICGDVIERVNPYPSPPGRGQLEYRPVIEYGICKSCDMSEPSSSTQKPNQT